MLVVPQGIARKQLDANRPDHRSHTTRVSTVMIDMSALTSLDRHSQGEDHDHSNDIGAP
jgi:hypothetical protein